MQVGLLENLLQVNLMLCFESWIAHLQLTRAKDAASDGDSFLGRVVRDVVGALVHVATAVALVSS